MTVLVYLKESLEAAKQPGIYAYPVDEINIVDLLNRITKKFGIERAKNFNAKDLMIYAASGQQRKPEEIILKAKPIHKSA